MVCKTCKVKCDKSEGLVSKQVGKGKEKDGGPSTRVKSQRFVTKDVVPPVGDQTELLEVLRGIWDELRTGNVQWQ